MMIVQMISDDPRFAEAVGPYLGSAVLAAELDGRVLDAPGKRWFVALAESGPAVGFCAARDTGPVVELETFWVSPSARGQGLGGRLLDAALAAYAGRHLHAWCSAGSRRLFERAGFRIVREAPADAPVWWAEVEMDRRNDSANAAGYGVLPNAA